MQASRRHWPALLLAFLSASTVWAVPGAQADHGHHGGPRLDLWLGLPPAFVEPGYLHGYPAYPRSYHGHRHRHRHDHHGGDSDSDSDSGHRHHRGCR